MTNRIALIVAACLVAAGCTQDKHAATSDFGPLTPEDRISARFGEFVDSVMSEDYEAVRSLVAPAQAKDFDPRAFVADRFRMSLGTFRVLVWDKKLIGVTPVRGTKHLLSTAAAHVRIMATNDVRPVYVNLWWAKQNDQWYILPYPGE